MSFHIDRLEARTATLPKEPTAFSTFSIKILMEDTEEINKSNMKYRRFIEV